MENYNKKFTTDYNYEADRNSSFTKFYDQNQPQVIEENRTIDIKPIDERLIRMPQVVESLWNYFDSFTDIGSNCNVCNKFFHTFTRLIKTVDIKIESLCAHSGMDESRKIFFRAQICYGIGNIALRALHDGIDIRSIYFIRYEEPFAEFRFEFNSFVLRIYADLCRNLVGITQYY
jgi:hypothetical protein